MDENTPRPNEPMQPDDPEWLKKFQELADEQLGHGSACEQVHPIIEQWYNDILAEDPPESRDSVLQAMACLSTELIMDAPDEVADMLEYLDEEEVSGWVQHILLVGRAMQIALDKGDLDDL